MYFWLILYSSAPFTEFTSSDLGCYIEILSKKFSLKVKNFVPSFPVILYYIYRRNNIFHWEISFIFHLYFFSADTWTYFINFYSSNIFRRNMTSGKKYQNSANYKIEIIRIDFYNVQYNYVQVLFKYWEHNSIKFWPWNIFWNHHNFSAIFNIFIHLIFSRVLPTTETKVELFCQFLVQIRELLWISL